MLSSEAPGATVRLENLTKVYSGHVVLNGLNLAIEAGEFFTLLGPSGSGKTTTLMLIAGFTEPTSGEIHVAGSALSRVPPHLRNVGVVFQNYSLFPHMSVADNIAFPLQLRGIGASRTRDRVDAMLDLVQLPGLAEQMPHQLSGGQQQRVALARALVFEPRVLLLDEPLSALDKSLRGQMQVELKELHRRLGTTVICVTHDQSEALALSDRIAILNHGRLEQVGTPESLYDHPASRFVATFIGESNVIKAQYIEASVDHAQLFFGAGRKVFANPVSTLQPGAGCEILLRPQHVRVGESARDAKNVYRGVIRNRIYLGDSVSLEIALDDQVVFARVPSDRATAELASGTDVTLGFEPEHARVYPLVKSEGER